MALINTLHFFLFHYLAYAHTIQTSIRKRQNNAASTKERELSHDPKYTEWEGNFIETTGHCGLATCADGTVGPDCCRGSAYDSTMTNCCMGTVITRDNPNERACCEVDECPGPNQWASMNKNEDLCCSNYRGVLKDAVTGGFDDCCGGGDGDQPLQGYNTGEAQCCRGVVQPFADGDTCCGRDVYDSASDMACCAPRNPTRGAYELYDTTTHTCCDGTIIDGANVECPCSVLEDNVCEYQEDPNNPGELIPYKVSVCVAHDASDDLHYHNKCVKIEATEDVKSEVKSDIADLKKSDLKEEVNAELSQLDEDVKSGSKVPDSKEIGDSEQKQTGLS